MKKFMFGLCGLTLFAAGASATPITIYRNPILWTAAVGGVFVIEPFDETGLQPFTGVATSSPTAGIGPARGVLSGSVWQDRVTRAGGESTTFLFLPSLVFGFAADWDSSPGGEGQKLAINVVLGTGASQFVAQIGPISDNPFWGFVATVPLDSFTISAGSGQGIAETFDLDNLRFGGVSNVAVPEPVTLWMAALGLLSFGAFGRRRS